MVFLPPEKPAFPNTNLSRIEELHGNQSSCCGFL